MSFSLIRVGILKQNIEDFRDEKVLDVVIMGNTNLWYALQESVMTSTKLEMTDEVGMQLGDIGRNYCRRKWLFQPNLMLKFYSQVWEYLMNDFHRKMIRDSNRHPI